jgi:hypothetical protein
MATLPNIPGLPNLPAVTGIPNPSNFIDVLKSPSVWTGKDGVAGVTALLSNPALQDKVQFGLMKSSFDTLVETGQIKTPGVNLTPPFGQLYDAAANFGKNLISASAGLVKAPDVLSKLSTSGLENSLSSLESKLSGLAGSLKSAVSGGLDGVGNIGSSIGSSFGSSLKGGAAGLSASITSAVNALNDPNAPPYTGDDPIVRARLGLPAITQAGADALGGASAALASNKGIADLGGLLANSSKFGVGTATAWAKGIESSANSAGLDVNSVEGVASSLKGIASGFESSVSGFSKSGGITGAIGNLGSLKSAGADFAAKAEALKPQMDSLAKQGQFAVNFSDFKLPAAVAGVIPAAGFKGTVDRATLNSAVSKLVGSSKIPAQNFSPQAVDIASLEAAALQAKAALNGSIPGGLAGLSRNSDAFVNSLGDPNAPPYTGDDPIIRQRLGLPPIQTA